MGQLSNWLMMALVFGFANGGFAQTKVVAVGVNDRPSVDRNCQDVVWSQPREVSSMRVLSKIGRMLDLERSGDKGDTEREVFFEVSRYEIAGEEPDPKQVVPLCGEGKVPGKLILSLHH